MPPPLPRNRFDPLTPELDEGQRQLILLALAILTLRRPGMLYAAGVVADALQGRPLLQQFRELVADVTPPEHAPC